MKTHRLIIVVVLILFCFSESFSEERKLRSYYNLKFQKIERQKYRFSCGTAVLATLFTHYYGIPVKEEEIIEEFFKRMVEEKRGISFLDMKKFSNSKGFDAYGYKMNFSGLIEIFNKFNLPIVVHMETDIQREKMKHFSIFVGLIDNFVILKDTFWGNTLLSVNEFLSMWSGYALLIIPPRDSEKVLTRIEKMREKNKKEAEKHVSKFYFYQIESSKIYKHFNRF